MSGTRYLGVTWGGIVMGAAIVLIGQDAAYWGLWLAGVVLNAVAQFWPQSAKDAR